MKKLPDNSVDSIVTDPPYGLKFMGKKWDYEIPSVEIWQEAIRVLKPGGHLLSFGGSRTYHRMAVAIEDAGFEIRDQIMWVYGSGFPKSHNIGKAVDKLQGNEREEQDERGGAIQKGSVAWSGNDRSGGKGSGFKEKFVDTKGTSPHEGWGTALKPAHEPICMARKPLSESTIAENVLKWGTGGINIDACRVEAQKGDVFGGGGLNSPVNGFMGNTENTYKKGTGFRDDSAQGRFPANFIHDGSDEVVGLFPDTKGAIRNPTGKQILNPDTGWNKNSMTDTTVRGFNDSGSAARFFYCAKSSKKDRNEGLEGFEEKKLTERGSDGERDKNSIVTRGTTENKNNHPTVKPTTLMQYLVRLVTPKNGTVLDPFMGSGSTGKACVLEGFDFIGIELDPEYCKIAEARIEYEVRKP